MSELEDLLRAELNRSAERAPGGTLLAEQIIAAVRTEPRPATRRGWPTWTMPLLAAGAVAAIVTGVLVGVDQLRDNTAGPAGPDLHTAQPSVLNSAPHPTSPPPTIHSSPTPTTATASTNSVPTNAVGLNNFVATDFTFYGTTKGWGLGTADCIKGTGTCPAMVRTADGGKSWRSMTQPPGGVTGIRFATPEIGYAYSDSVFEMTTDGGQSWASQPGGAIALETLNGNVVRLVSPHTGCPGPCDARAEYAPIGSPNWKMSDLGPLGGGGVQLVRSDADVYVLVTRNPAGGAVDQQSTLYASTDNGAHWASRGEPCPQRGAEFDSWSVAASPGGTVTALCAPRPPVHQFVVTSSNTGASFSRTAGTLPGASAEMLTGDPATVLLAAGIGAYRSTDAGASWSRIPEITGNVTFAGFESKTLGRIVTAGGRRIWTTTDAGAHWTSFTFPG